jgi:hypothetical protein
VIKLTELEKLQTAAELIEMVTEGKQRFDTAHGFPYIFMDQPAGELEKHPNIAIRMIRELQADQKQYSIRFYAHFDMIGPAMDAAALRGLEQELGKTRTLLDTLEAQTFTLSMSELAQFAEWVERREEQTLANGKSTTSQPEQRESTLAKIRAVKSQPKESRKPRTRGKSHNEEL